MSIFENDRPAGADRSAWSRNSYEIAFPYDVNNRIVMMRARTMNSITPKMEKMMNGIRYSRPVGCPVSDATQSLDNGFLWLILWLGFRQRDIHILC